MSLASVESVRARLLAGARPLTPSEWRPLVQCAGATLAEALSSPVAVPPRRQQCHGRVCSAPQR